MDRIPIGGSGSGEGPDQPDNVVHLPSTQASEEPPGSEKEAVDEDIDEEDMSWEEAVAADAEAAPDEETGPPVPGAGLTSLMEQGVRVGAGLFSAGASAVADALRSSMPETGEDDAKDPAATMAGAGLGAAVTAAEAAASAATSAADAVGPVLSWASNPEFLRGAGEAAAGATRILDGQWKAAQSETAGAAGAFLTALIPEITEAILDQIDLNKIVRERVDVNAIVEDVDLDRIVDRIDVGAVVEKIDVDAIVAKVDVNQVVDRVDMEHVVDTLPIDTVLDRVDVNEVVERVDVRAVVDRLDLTEITKDVMDEIDLPAIDPGVLGRDGERDGADRSRPGDERRPPRVPHRRPDAATGGSRPRASPQRGGLTWPAPNPPLRLMSTPYRRPSSRGCARAWCRAPRRW